jgi:hypothetical protein
MAWYLNPALTRFRAAVDAAWPNRDRTSDGTIGNEAHQATFSDHNPDPDGSVDAWDMDVDGVPVERLKAAFQAHEASLYWIHNDQIASRDDGWVRRSYAYAGPDRNRHTRHVHWNTRPSHENSTAPWEVAMTIQELHALLRAVLEAETPMARQARDMIRGGVQSPVAGQGLLTPLRQEVAALHADVTALRQEVAAIGANDPVVAEIRDQVVDEIAERLTG